VCKNNPENKGYFIRRLKAGFKACSVLYPEMARTMNKKALNEVMQFLKEQGEMDYYDFIIEETEE
jgi:hypothetical protein